MFPHVLDVRCIFDECFVVCSSFKDKEFLLAVHTPGRKFYMQCDTEEDRGSWRKAFESLHCLKSDTEQHVLNTESETTNGSEREEIDVDSFESDDGLQEISGTDL
jgi:hypothetical protein